MPEDLCKFLRLEQRRCAAANIDGADLRKRPGVSKGIKARIQLLKIGIERCAQVARSKTA